MSMMVSFVLSFFPRDVLDEILNLIESVSEDFPSYSCIDNHTQRCIRYESRMVVRNPYSIEAHFLSFFPSFLSLVFLYFFFVIFFFRFSSAFL